MNALVLRLHVEIMLHVRMWGAVPWVLMQTDSWHSGAIEQLLSNTISDGECV